MKNLWDMGIRGGDSDNERVDRGAEMEQDNIEDRVNEFVEGARLQEVRISDNGEEGRIDAEVVEQVNVGDMEDDMAEEERLLGEENVDIWGIEDTIDWAEEARLLGEMDEIVGNGQGTEAGGLVEGAMGGSDGTHGEGTTQRAQDNSNTQEGDTDKTDMNNNKSVRGQGPRTRAYRQPYGRTLGRGGKQKYE